MTTLDRGRPFGEVHPSGPAFYEQDGKLFNQSGQEITANGTVIARTGKKAENVSDEPVIKRISVAVPRHWRALDWRNELRPLAAKVSSIPIRSKADAFMAIENYLAANPQPWMMSDMVEEQEIIDGAEDEPSVNKPPMPDEQGEKAAEPAEVDLAAWGRGEKQYLVGDVYKTIRQKYAKGVTTKRDAVDFLIEEGLISAEEAMRVN